MYEKSVHCPVLHVLMSVMASRFTLPLNIIAHSYSILYNIDHSLNPFEHEKCMTHHHHRVNQITNLLLLLYYLLFCVCYVQYLKTAISLVWRQFDSIEFNLSFFGRV